jgi:hypothetical protein
LSDTIHFYNHSINIIDYNNESKRFVNKNASKKQDRVDEITLITIELIRRREQPVSTALKSTQKGVLQLAQYINCHRVSHQTSKYRA